MAPSRITFATRFPLMAFSATNLLGAVDVGVARLVGSGVTALGPPVGSLPTGGIQWASLAFCDDPQSLRALAESRARSSWPCACSHAMRLEA